MSSQILTVEVTPEDLPDLEGRLNNLGNKVESRYERTGKMTNPEEATTTSENARTDIDGSKPSPKSWKRSGHACLRELR